MRQGVATEQRYTGRLAAAGLGMMMALLAGGCSLFYQADADPKLAAQLAPLPYPKNAKQGPDLDILVVTHGSTLQLVNRTSHSYHQVQLWLNQQWVGLVDDIAIGVDNQVDLEKCINQFGEPFPIGPFFHPDQAFPVVLAEIYDPATHQRCRLIARQAGL